MMDEIDYANRNADIITDALNGVTLAEIAERNGISRERVRQVLLDNTGLSAGDIRRYWNAWDLSDIRFFCKGCRRRVSELAARGHNFHKFCSNECRNKYNMRDHHTVLGCDNCGTEYHPWRSRAFTDFKKNFCTKDCYMEWITKHAEEQFDG